VFGVDVVVIEFLGCEIRRKCNGSLQGDCWNVSALQTQEDCQTWAFQRDDMNQTNNYLFIKAIYRELQVWENVLEEGIAREEVGSIGKMEFSRTNGVKKCLSEANSMVCMIMT
jgi:hypothetical protein